MMVQLGELMAQKVPSLDPSKFRDETFELWSIPAFDQGRPDCVSGGEVGSAKKIVQPNDVLLSRIVPHIRRAWVVKKPNSKVRQIGSGEWIIFRSDRFYPDYLKHFLVSDPFHSQFMQTVAGVGGSLLRARPEGVKAIELSLPSLEEQKRIAAILDQTDELRRKRQRALDRLNQFGLALFHEMFEGRGDFDGWPPTTLPDLADIQVGYPFKSSDYSETGNLVRLCRGANILPDRTDWTELARLPVDLAASYLEFSLREGDTVIAMDRPWISSGFKVARIGVNDLPALLVQRVARVRALSADDSDYLHFMVKSQEFQAACRTTETTVPHISPTDIRTFRFHRPPKDKRQKFGALISKLRSTQHFTVTSGTRLDNLFQTLQHRAFRGEL